MDIPEGLQQEWEGLHHVNQRQGVLQIELRDLFYEEIRKRPLQMEHMQHS